MARRYTITVGEHDYTGETASAKSQLEALHICLQTSLITALEGDHSEMALVGVFARVPYETVQKLAGLVLVDRVTRDDEVPVGPNLFADEPQDWFLLLHYVLRENLQGFWKLRRPTADSAAERLDQS